MLVEEGIRILKSKLIEKLPAIWPKCIQFELTSFEVRALIKMVDQLEEADKAVLKFSDPAVAAQLDLHLRVRTAERDELSRQVEMFKLIIHKLARKKSNV